MSYESKIIYGPVDSRRLGRWQNETLIECGRSLGVNLSKVPTCSFDCIYCSCGKTQILTLNPDTACYSLKEIKKGLEEGFREHASKQTKIDYISFVGWGEPTLHPNFDKVANLFFKIKEEYFSNKPTAIFTNSTTLSKREVREALKKFDRTFFKLDTNDKITFQKVNRPFQDIELEEIIGRLAEFSKETDKVELSSMVLGANYKDLASKQYAETIRKINPKNNRVYLCTPDWLRPISENKGISLMPEKEILEYVKNSIESSGHKAIILPPKRQGLHPLIRK